jgi:hypothetical protein
MLSLPATKVCAARTGVGGGMRLPLAVLASQQRRVRAPTHKHTGTIDTCTCACVAHTHARAHAHTHTHTHTHTCAHTHTSAHTRAHALNQGFEIGSGFSGAGMTGSEHNDAFFMEGGAVRTRTNRCARAAAAAQGAARQVPPAPRCGGVRRGGWACCLPQPAPAHTPRNPHSATASAPALTAPTRAQVWRHPGRHQQWGGHCAARGLQAHQHHRHQAADSHARGCAQRVRVCAALFVAATCGRASRRAPAYTHVPIHTRTSACTPTRTAHTCPSTHTPQHTHTHTHTHTYPSTHAHARTQVRRRSCVRGAATTRASCRAPCRWWRAWWRLCWPTSCCRCACARVGRRGGAGRGGAGRGGAGRGGAGRGGAGRGGAGRRTAARVCAGVWEACVQAVWHGPRTPRNCAADTQSPHAHTHTLTHTDTH